MPADWTLRAAWIFAIGLWLAIVGHWFGPGPAAAPADSPARAAALPNLEHDLPAPQLVPVRERAPQAHVATEAERVTVHDACNDAAATDPAALDTLLQQQRQSAWPRVLAALRARADANAGHGAELLALEALAKGQAAPAGERLVRLAAASRDPFAVWLGVRECQQHAPADAAACAALGWQHLVALDGGNAAWWLELAAHDATALDEAMFRAAQAPRLDAHEARLSRAVQAAWPADGTPLQRAAVLDAVARHEGRMALGALSAAARYCSEAAVRDANRAQVCEALARKMADRGGTLVAAVGRGIGARLGWPDPAPIARPAERTASCPALQAVAERAREGEQALARHALLGDDAALAAAERRGAEAPRSLAVAAQGAIEQVATAR